MPHCSSEEVAFAEYKSCLWPLNQFNAVASRIDRDSNEDASVSEWTRVAGHRAAGGFDGGDCRRHVLHVEDYVRDRVLYVVGIAMHDHDRLALIGLRALDRRTEVDKDLGSSGRIDPINFLHAERRLIELC